MCESVAFCHAVFGAIIYTAVLTAILHSDRTVEMKYIGKELRIQYRNTTICLLTSKMLKFYKFTIVS